MINNVTSKVEGKIRMNRFMGMMSNYMKKVIKYFRERKNRKLCHKYDVNFNFFNELKIFMQSYLETILDKEIELKKLKSLRTVFDNIPLKFQITKSPSPENQTNKLPSGLFFKSLDKEIDNISHADIYHNERVALLGELLNTLRHELSNPLFGLQLSSQLLLDEIDESNKPLIEEIIQSISRSQEIIDNFTKLYSRSNKKLSVELNKLFKEVFTLTKSQSRGVLFETNIEKETFVTTNPVWLAQILFNLIINSSQAIKSKKGEQGKITIEYRSILKGFEIDFKDNGPGVPREQIDKVFSPFFTTKEKGTGLGLAITKMLVEKLNGTISCINTQEGAHFKVRFLN
jgi:signal transduction histidine kinase